MSRYSGRYYRGAARDMRAAKRAEAEARQARSTVPVVPDISGFAKAFKHFAQRTVAPFVVAMSALVSAFSHGIRRALEAEARDYTEES